MRELGIDLSDRRPQRLSTELAHAADVVVTMGCGDACPYIPGKRYIDWELEDPNGRPVEEVRATREDIARRVEELVAELDARNTREPRTLAKPGGVAGRRRAELDAFGRRRWPPDDQDLDARRSTSSPAPNGCSTDVANRYPEFRDQIVACAAGLRKVHSWCAPAVDVAERDRGPNRRAAADAEVARVPRQPRPASTRHDRTILSPVRALTCDGRL